MAELFVTNYNPHFTGVSATAANVIRAQNPRYDLSLVGQPLSGCPVPISKRAAAAASQKAPKGKPFAIWHVRRNPEMRHAIWLRDVRRLPIRIVFTSAAQRLHSTYPRWLISRMDAVIATTVTIVTITGLVAGRLLSRSLRQAVQPLHLVVVAIRCIADS